jgi:hypothetical protein
MWNGGHFFEAGGLSAFDEERLHERLFQFSE